jgi:hypothetical protein
MYVQRANLRTGTVVLPRTRKSRKKPRCAALNGRVNTPPATPVDAGPEPHLAEGEHPLVERMTVIPEVARPLFERARPWADPLVDEMRPLLNDLRPVVQDLRVRLAELLVRAIGAATLLRTRLDVDAVASQSRTLFASARRRTSMRPTLGSVGVAPSSAADVRVPRVIARPRLPSIRVGLPVRSAARRLRPGRWAFRTVAVGIIALVLSNTTLRDAMVAEISWSRSIVETLEMPNVQLPTIELPSIQIPAFEMPSIQLPGAETVAAPKLVPAPFDLPPLGAYRAAFETQASYPIVAPGSTVEWVVALRNTGSVGWYRGVAGAQAALALSDGTEVAVQSTAYVAPGQVGWFVARFRAPASAGTHSVPLFPRIDGRGELPDLGILALVTVR